MARKVTLEVLDKKDRLKIKFLDWVNDLLEGPLGENWNEESQIKFAKRVMSRAYVLGLKTGRYL